MCKRVQRTRAKGYKLPENTVYVGRPTVWGNPFKADIKTEYSHIVNIKKIVWDTPYENKWKTICSKPYEEFPTLIKIFNEGWRTLGCIHLSPMILKDNEALELYRLHIEYKRRTEGDEFLRPLIGKDLACWCPPPDPDNPDAIVCHADILLDILKTIQ